MLNIVLFEPEIIENAGNIARMCVGFNARLHLIRPYGFILRTDKFNKDFIRTATNHLEHLELLEYDDFEQFVTMNNVQDKEIYLFTRYGTKAPSDYVYENWDEAEIYLMFGKESTGIDHAILQKYSQWIRIPSSYNLRSLNIANSVAMGMYEVARQNQYKNLLKYEPHKKFEV
ncbi:tRNA (cytidine(34)-2'-O)-methyltransferase [Ureaplasma miroungigenitalium]|uniref:tRNA (cytidine(34)-2'-O)-methyltransferase n=1 Tax=Ureaplasma miroungigenitalium TaxID=1042321 RepID=UPI0021E97241|nr:tRNA (cytidine(34)-2'-O)-methyltransferase [Ureaplasma miroungigenitalium]MCV3734093.1 tRNA (cytidine(34)-2'-O)-methyltransferase [Ureaplasma miroungigenitalium]